MVENKPSSYDDQNPPLVQATFAADAIGNTSSNPDQPPNPSSKQDSPATRNVPDTEGQSYHDKKVASGTAGAVLGFLFGGPVFAALLGFIAAYASQKNDAAGDIARSLGDIAIQTKKKATEIDEKHHVVDRSKRAVGEAWESAKEYDQEHRVLEKAKDASVAGWDRFVRFVQDNRVLERGVEGVGRGYEYVAERVGGNSGTNSNDLSPAGSDQPPKEPAVPF